MSFYIREFEWEVLDPKIHERVNEVLSSWGGTPYANGQIVKGVASYCAAFPVAVLDELFSVDLPIPKLSFHRTTTAKRNLKFMLERYKEECSVLQLEPRSLEPGDVLVLGEQSPTHCMIVGGTVNHFWHSNSPLGVVRTGCGFHSQILRVYRVTNKVKWIS